MSSASSPPRAMIAASIASTGASASSVSSFRTGPSGHSTSSTLGPGPSLSSKEGLRELCAKRIATLVYLKAVLSGRQHYAQTVLFARNDLQSVFEAERMRKRSFRHMALGLTLCPLVELTSLPEFARAALTALTEVESLPETAGGAIGSSGSSPTGGSLMTGLANGEKRGMRSLFTNKLKAPKRGGTFSDLYPPEGISATSAGSSFASSSTYGLETSSLAGVSLPFVPDFIQTFFTLCDVLIELYAKLSAFIGAPPASSLPPSPSATSPSPFETQPSTLAPKSATSASSIPTPNSLASSFPHPEGGDIGTTHFPGTPAFAGPMSSQLTETILRLDGKVKKLLSQVIKELDALARNIVKEELANLEAAICDHNGGASNSSSGAHTASGKLAGSKGMSSTPSGHSLGREASASDPASTSMGTTSPYTGLPGPPDHADH
ncbi:unnamed protein product [Parajaminaea phylloscopi]